MVMGSPDIIVLVITDGGPVPQALRMGSIAASIPTTTVLRPSCPTYEQPESHRRQGLALSLPACMSPRRDAVRWLLDRVIRSQSDDRSWVASISRCLGDLQAAWGVEGRRAAWAAAEFPLSDARFTSSQHRAVGRESAFSSPIMLTGGSSRRVLRF